MKINELSEPSGAAVKFKELGDTVEGTITYIGQPYDGTNPNNGKAETQVRIMLDVAGEDEPQALYVRTKPSHQMARAIAEAVRKAGTDELAEGGVLKVGWVDNEDVGKPQPMKVYKARYTPPAKSAKVDDWDDTNQADTPAAKQQVVDPF